MSTLLPATRAAWRSRAHSTFTGVMPSIALGLRRFLNQRLNMFATFHIAQPGKASFRQQPSAIENMGIVARQSDELGVAEKCVIICTGTLDIFAKLRAASAQQGNCLFAICQLCSTGACRNYQIG